MAVGERLGIGDVQRCASDRAGPERIDAARRCRCVDRGPGSRSTQSGPSSARRRASRMPVVSGVSARASTTRSAVGNTSSRSASVPTRRAPSICSTWRRSTVTSHPKGPSRRSSDSVIPPPPRITTRAPRRFRPWGAPHDVGAGERAQPAHACQRQHQDVLGDGLGVHALRARPQMIVVEHRHERLHAGPGQLDPVGVGRLGEGRGQLVGPRRRCPHDRLGVGELDDVAARPPRSRPVASSRSATGARATRGGPAYRRRPTVEPAPRLGGRCSGVDDTLQFVAAAGK